MIAAVGTVDGVVLVDVENEELLGPGTEVPEVDVPHVDLPRVVAAAQAGAIIVCIVERRLREGGVLHCDRCERPSL